MRATDVNPTPRPERLDDFLTEWGDVGGWRASKSDVQMLVDEIGQARRLWVKAEADLVAAYDVIRRLRGGWEPNPGGLAWLTDDGLTVTAEPMSEAERAVIEAAKEAGS